MKWCAPGSRRRVLRGVVAAVLAASTLVGVSGSPAGAWSSDDGAVAVFGGTNTNSASSVAVDSSGGGTTGLRYRGAEAGRMERGTDPKV